MTITIDLAKALTNCVRYNKAPLKNPKSLNLPLKSIQELFQTRTGVYKIAPEEKVIDALKNVKTSRGKAKFSEDALRAKIKEVNSGFAKKFDPKGQYSDMRCREIAQFAERSDVNLADVAEI